MAGFLRLVLSAVLLSCSVTASAAIDYNRISGGVSTQGATGQPDHPTANLKAGTNHHDRHKHPKKQPSKNEIKSAAKPDALTHMQWYHWLVASGIAVFALFSLYRVIKSNPDARLAHVLVFAVPTPIFSWFLFTWQSQLPFWVTNNGLMLLLYGLLAIVAGFFLSFLAIALLATRLMMIIGVLCIVAGVFNGAWLAVLGFFLVVGSIVSAWAMGTTEIRYNSDNSWQRAMNSVADYHHDIATSPSNSHLRDNIHYRGPR